ncbi:MAG: hypothetical protein J6Q12_10065 [Bacteroidales bacterium]|nr:hypothetical protein [Bacteroidales bacterium]
MSSSFHKLFPRHISRVRAAIGEENFVLYNQHVDAMLYNIIWLVFGSLVNIVLCSVGYVDNPDRLSKVTVVGVLLIWVGVSLLKDLKKLRSYLKDCPQDYDSWKKVVLCVCVLALAGFTMAAYTFFTKVDFSGKSKARVEQIEEKKIKEEKIKEEVQNIVIRKIGLTVNIPQGWTEVEWGPSNSMDFTRPNYYFWCDKGERRLWMNIYGFRSVPEATAIDELEMFEKDAKSCINDKVFEESGLTEINSVPVLRYVGTKIKQPEYIYACYYACIKGSLIYFTYSFPKRLDYETELKAADEIFAMIEPSVPVDARPKDYEIADGRINFKSARINLKFPSKESEIKWTKDTRSEYEFAMDMGGYEAFYDLLVVWTSENAQLDEYYDTFLSSATGQMDEPYEMVSYIRRLGGATVLRMAGSSKEDPGKTVLYYYIIHKGARLTITTKFSSELAWRKEMEKMDDLLSKSDFY